MASGDPFSDSVSTYTNYDWNVAATGSASESEQNTKSTHHGWNAMRAGMNDLNACANGAKAWGVIPHMTFHSWAKADNAAVHVPWNSVAEVPESTGEQKSTVIPAPYDGWLVKAILHTDASLAATGIELFTGSALGSVSTSAGTEVSQTQNANTSTSYAFGSDYAFSAGDLLTVVVDPTTNTSYSAMLVLAWAFDTRT